MRKRIFPYPVSEKTRKVEQDKAEKRRQAEQEFEANQRRIEASVKALETRRAGKES